MLMRIFALGVAAVAFGSLALVDATTSTAIAGEPSRQIITEEPSRQIDTCKSYDDFDTFKNTCVNPTAYGHQIPPSEIHISCEKRQTKWVPNRKSIELRLPIYTDKNVGASNNKLHCTDDRLSEPDEQIEYATCTLFEETELTYSRTLQATCNDVLKFESAMELCDATLKNAGAWAMVRESKTGDVRNSCDADVQTQAVKPSQPSQE